MNLSKEVKAAIIVVSGLIALVWGFNFLKGKNLFSKQRVFYSIYKQVDGLQNGNPIQINGFKVGQVGDIQFMDDGKLIVKLVIDADVKIPKNSVAQIGSSDLLGSKNVVIILKNHMQLAESGDTLQAENQASMADELTKQIGPIKEKAENIMATVDSILTSIQYVFNKNTRNNLTNSFASIERTMSNLEHTTDALDTIMSSQQNRLKNIFINVESLTHNLKNNNEKISKIFSNFSVLSDSLVKSNVTSTVRNANKSLENLALIMDKINKGQGSMGMLINNDSLYNNLAASSADLDKLIIDIKENPKKYVHFSVFGGSKNKGVKKQKVPVLK